MLDTNLDNFKVSPKVYFQKEVSQMREKIEELWLMQS